MNPNCRGRKGGTTKHSFFVKGEGPIDCSVIPSGGKNKALKPKSQLTRNKNENNVNKKDNDIDMNNSGQSGIDNSSQEVVDYSHESDDKILQQIHEDQMYV